METIPGSTTALTLFAFASHCTQINPWQLDLWQVVGTQASHMVDASLCIGNAHMTAEITDSRGESQARSQSSTGSSGRMHDWQRLTSAAVTRARSDRHRAPAPVLLGIEAVGDSCRLIIGQHGAGLAVHERRLLLLRAELEAPVRHDDAARQRPRAGVLPMAMVRGCHAGSDTGEYQGPRHAGEPVAGAKLLRRGIRQHVCRALAQDSTHLLGCQQGCDAVPPQASCHPHGDGDDRKGSVAL